MSATKDSVNATNLKVSGVHVSPAGDFLGAAGTELIVLADPGFGNYRKLVIADGRLAGAVLYGDTADAPWYLELIRTGAAIELFLRGPRLLFIIRRAARCVMPISAGDPPSPQKPA